MPRRIASSAFAACLAVILAGGAASAATGGFYQGKTVRIVVGWAAGGGYDVYARMIARHLPNHLPGNPTVLVENMTGAGSVKAANYIYNVVAADGLTMGSFTSDIPLVQSLGDKGIKVDSRQFPWVGAAFKATFACAVMGFTGLDSWRAIEASGKSVRMGAPRRGSIMNVVPTLMNESAGTKFSVVVGYRGTADIKVALNTRELDGACWNWMSMKTGSAGMLQAKGDLQLKPFAISRPTSDPETRGLPLLGDIIASPVARMAYEAFQLVDEMPGPYALPPNTPSDRIAAMRAAFKATVHDPAFLEDGRRASMEFEYVSPDEIGRSVNKLFSISDEAKTLLKTVMGIAN